MKQVSERDKELFINLYDAIAVTIMETCSKHTREGEKPSVVIIMGAISKILGDTIASYPERVRVQAREAALEAMDNSIAHIGSRLDAKRAKGEVH